MKKILYTFLLILVTASNNQAQIVDEIVAVVADKIILRSEIEVAYEQAVRELGKGSDSLKFAILEQKLIENLLVLKAQIDSLPVNEERIDAELDERIRYFSQEYGGEKRLEEIYGKSISEIKAANREKIKNNQLAQAMMAKILKDVKVTPTDVKNFYNEIPEDSLPYISSEVELAQLVIEPKVSKESRQIAYEKIAELKRRIVEDGDKFSTLALIYSDDRTSASRGGDLGFFGRGMMVPEFEGAAFKLKPDSISKIIETKYGYHIIQGIQRRGEEANARHILIMPKIYPSDILLAKKWRELCKTSTFFEQKCLEGLVHQIDKSEFYEFPVQVNYGWWRLWQGIQSPENLQKEWSFLRKGDTDSGICVQGKPLQSIHTHFSEKKDLATFEYNQFVLKKLKLLSSMKKTKQLLQFLEKNFP